MKKLIRALALLVLCMPLPSLAMDVCKPKELDLCEFAAGVAGIFLKSIPPAERQYAERGLAFTRAEAEGSLLKYDITLDMRSDALGEIDQDPRIAKAMLSARMHQMARSSACGEEVSIFIENGGRQQNTYLFRDGKTLTVALISDCSDAANTWAGTDADPCTPLGWDICSQAKDFATKVNARIEPVEQQFTPKKHEFAMRSVRSEQGTAITETVFYHTRAEFERIFPDQEKRARFFDSLQDANTQMFCKQPTLILLAYGGSFRHRYFFRDGGAMADITISQCPASPQQ